MKVIKNLDELEKDDLQIAGGKGANLGALIRAGLPVPPGFCITTRAYSDFVMHNHLDEVIRKNISQKTLEDQNTIENTSTKIRCAFQKSKIPLNIEAEIKQAYAKLFKENTPVAVRSSATAEDLPDMSFAGQQDTYLNIVGIDALLESVIKCWASLWTPRAIAYRAHNKIAQEDIFLAVIVQQMVQSESSGVLFTANPLTGKRSETVIDAIIGLGEALVSGQVEPDHFTVESQSGKILDQRTGAKALSIHALAEGGTHTLFHPDSNQASLTDEQIVLLTQLGQSAQDWFGCPQDIEWAFSGNKPYLVQSRPITSLFPIDGLKENPLETLLSFAVWQGMLDPYTPVGQDVFGMLVVGMGRFFGSKINLQEQRVFIPICERLFVNISGLLHNSFGCSMAMLFVSAIDPVSGSILAEILTDPKITSRHHFSLANQMKLFAKLTPIPRTIISNFINPPRGRAQLENKINTLLDGINKTCESVPDLKSLLESIENDTGEIASNILPRLVGGIASGQVPYQILLRISSKISNSEKLLMELTRSLPYNVTTQMDLVLWHIAEIIKNDAKTCAKFENESGQNLTKDFNENNLPPLIQSAIENFITQYGMRGVGEIDMGRPRWREDPSTLFTILKSYLQINPELSPEILFKQGSEKANLSSDELMDALRKQPGGFLKIPLYKTLIHRFRELGGLRETPKFFIIRILGLYRTALLREGTKLVNSGRIMDAQDVFFLHLWELKVIETDTQTDWKALVMTRKTVYEQEFLRKRIPRIILGDGRVFYNAPASSAVDPKNTLSGSPVSAGVVEGNARIVHNPHNVQLKPGEILVCPATDPAWTPLFLAAGGLITEVGGMMTHGSVVAREYGIPAVVGVQDATSRLHDGQKVRVDGSSGIITLMEK